ncbi:MAG: hypothetical protein E6F98_10815 [Actinobacteria bacterium]|nr:MAG: hypothetical protein E6F98_10815 [Actinomycetota bacterium]
MVGWIRRRNSAGLRLRFIDDTIGAHDLLHHRVGQVEEHLQEQQASSLDAETASVAGLEVRDLIQQYSATHETHDLGKADWDVTSDADQSQQCLDGLMPVLTPIGLREHVCLLPTLDGYELVERPGGAPMVGAVVDLGEGLQGEVVKVARSPLPNDKRRCAYLLQALAAVTMEEDMISLELVSSSP